MPTPMRHYISSSDSDHHGLPPVTEKKKKKKKPPPQAQIDRIWKDFVSKKPSKAVSVLPFANPVPAPATSSENGGNELLAAGYERAVQECRLKVRKIISECRRVNLRYRDPVFDLDWDLRTRKGNCLNHLGEVLFDISRSRNWSAFSNIPKAVKRVHEIFEKPTFMAKTSYSDIKQGALGNCWLMASLTGLANATDLIKRTCVEYDTRIGIYGFVFFRDGEWVYTIIDDKLYLKSPCWDHPSLQREILQQIDREDVERVYRQTYQTGSKALFFAQCKNQNETWLPLLEKAYAKCHGDYASLEGGWIGEGLEDLTGGVTTELLASDILDIEGFWDNELSKVNEEFLFGCSTGLLEPGYGERAGIQECHAYTIMEARTIQKGEKKGTRLLKLRNPWGKVNRGNWEGAWSDGSKEWTEEVLAELGHHFGTDSVFWISYEDLLRKYTHFDRTRLFRDPDWRCSQKWAGVVVPWKAHFEEQFRFKLTKETPLVLTLSQLDNRFFKGLKGQYKFHVHFRLHEKGRLDDDDYIVRSHGNYLMNRSVGIELPSMLPGDYSVFVSVTARRNTEKPTVEEVVKRETRKRSENEKLAQVGQAYDQAHAKAAGHLEQLAAVRKNRNQKKASECRKDIRQHAWEKRHIERVVKKKQAKKNKAKKDAKLADRKKRREAAEAELKKKIEAEEAERKKQEEAEAAEKKKQEEAEAAEKKKREEAEAAQKKKQEEAEEADRKRREAEDEVKNTKDQAVQTEPNPDTGTEDKSGVDGQSKEAGPPNQAETELAKDANRSSQHGEPEKLADEGHAEQASRKDTEGFSDSEPEQDTPQSTPDAERASLSIAPSVQDDDEQAESGSDKGNSSKAENSGEMAGDSASKPDVTAAQNKTEDNVTAEPNSGGEDKTWKDQDTTSEEKSEETAEKGAENETVASKTDDKKANENDPEPKEQSGEPQPSEAKDDGNESVDSKPSTEVQEQGSKESLKDEKPKDEESKDEKLEDEKSKDEEPKDEEPKDGESKDEKPKDEESKDEKPKDEESKDEKPKDEESKDEKPKDEESKDEKPKDEESKDEKPKDEELKDEKPKDEKTKDASSSKPLPKLEVQISDSEVSSASPVTDWEELYSSDNTCRKPIKERGWIPVPVATSSSSNTTKKDDESDNENLPEPWNAICIVGFRVYSKDEGLELGVVVDGKVDGWPEDNTESKEEEDKEGSDEDDEEKAEDEDGRDGDDESSDSEEDETKEVPNDNDANADD